MSSSERSGDPFVVRLPDGTELRRTRERDEANDFHDVETAPGEPLKFDASGNPIPER